MAAGACPNCNSRNQYESQEVSAGGGHAPNFLPGLGRWYGAAKFKIVLCQDCGLTRFFASREAVEKVSASGKWSRVP